MLAIARDDAVVVIVVVVVHHGSDSPTTLNSHVSRTRPPPPSSSLAPTFRPGRPRSRVRASHLLRCAISDTHALRVRRAVPDAVQFDSVLYTFVLARRYLAVTICSVCLSFFINKFGSHAHAKTMFCVFISSHHTRTRTISLSHTPTPVPPHNANSAQILSCFRKYALILELRSSFFSEQNVSFF